MAVKCDVLVVGAGPAGALAANTLLDNYPEADVIQIERKEPIGFPVECAEVISDKRVKLVPIEIPNKFIYKTVHYIKKYFDKGLEQRTEFPYPYYIMDRIGWEQYMANQAKNKGCEVLNAELKGISIDRDRVSAKIIRDDANMFVKSKLVIAADGYASETARAVGVLGDLSASDAAITYHKILKDIEIDHDALEFYFKFDYFGHAYGWVFPNENESANVGFTLLKSEIEDGFQIGEVAEKFFGLERFEGAEEVAAPIISCLPFSKPSKLVGDRIMVAGDAAKFCTAVFGSGIGNAMLSGRVAGEVAALALQKNRYSKEFLDLYANHPDIKKLVNELEAVYELRKLYDSLSREQILEIGRKHAENPEARLKEVLAGYKPRKK